MKLKLTEPKKAVHHYSYWGPKFGDGADLYVDDRSNTRKSCRIFLRSYEYPKGKSGSEGGQFIVGGKDGYFQIDEIEVFNVNIKVIIIWLTI